MVKHDSIKELKSEAERETKNEPHSHKSGKRSNWIPVVALVILAVAAFLIYSGLATPLTTALQNTETISGVQTALTYPTVTPQTGSNTQPNAAAGSEGAPDQSAGSSECKLFKNKYTSEFKCISCVVNAAGNPNAYDPTSGCIYTSRDWTIVPSGTSGYSCEYDATLELKCKTIKA